MPSSEAGVNGNGTSKSLTGRDALSNVSQLGINYHQLMLTDIPNQLRDPSLLREDAYVSDKWLRKEKRFDVWGMRIKTCLVHSLWWTTDLVRCTTRTCNSDSAQSCKRLRCQGLPTCD